MGLEDELRGMKMASPGSVFLRDLWATAAQASYAQRTLPVPLRPPSGSIPGSRCLGTWNSCCNQAEVVMVVVVSMFWTSVVLLQCTAPTFLHKGRDIIQLPWGLSGDKDIGFVLDEPRKAWLPPQHTARLSGNRVCSSISHLAADHRSAEGDGPVLRSGSHPSSVQRFQALTSSWHLLLPGI